MVEILDKTSSIKLGWYGHEKAVTNYRAYRGKLDDLLIHTDYSPESVLRYTEPSVSSKESFFDSLKAKVTTECASWSSWDEMFQEIEKVAEDYEETYRKGLSPHVVSKKPSGSPKTVADQKVSANKEQVPKVGFRCFTCEKKYVSRRTDELLEGEQSHGYAFASDGSGPCRCPMGHLKPDKCEQQQAFLREQAAKRQKR